MTIGPGADYPEDSVPWTAASGQKVNADAQAVSPADLVRTAYLTGVMVTQAGASPAPVVGSISGVVDGPLSFMYGGAAGAPLPMPFSHAVAGAGPGQQITVDVPALGAGVSCCVIAHGYLL